MCAGGWQKSSVLLKADRTYDVFREVPLCFYRSFYLRFIAAEGPAMSLLMGCRFAIATVKLWICVVKWPYVMSGNVEKLRFYAEIVIFL